MIRPGDIEPLFHLDPRVMLEVIKVYRVRLGIVVPPAHEEERTLVWHSLSRGNDGIPRTLSRR